MANVKEPIKEYWDERARRNAGAPETTTNDVYLRELEASTLIDTLGVMPRGTVLDVGCADGYTTCAVAEALPHLRFVGVDCSGQMIETALDHLAARPALEGRVSFSLGDATDLGLSCGDSTYDAVTTDRCLINLGSREDQARAIAQIAAYLKPGGYYVAIENFHEGHEAMNTLRRAVGLPEIPVRWHNLFFDRNEFVEMTEPFFDSIRFKDFSSSYYFATRVIYSAMCMMRGEDPDYRHEIHQLAVKLPWFGEFSPVKMVVMRRKAG
jgi:ubiquinone/menaquinone biosynthesis C-methylase UbiE